MTYDNDDFKNDPRLEFWAEQRKDRGFDDRELWNLDHTIAQFILPRLKAFKLYADGYPVGLTEKKWNYILKEMIWSFELFAAGEEFPPCKYTEEQKILWRKRKQRGINLFAKYLTHLWD